MPRVTFTKRCPRCKRHDSFYRVKQPFWTRVLLSPFQRRAYYCSLCDDTFLLLGAGR